MVLCFLNMRMATLFCCNTDLITGKVSDSRGVLRGGDGSWNTLFPVMAVPCANLRRYLVHTKISEKIQQDHLLVLAHVCCFQDGVDGVVPANAWCQYLQP
jgi:hypothetical protein